MAITPSNYLDLRNLFVNEIVGSALLFLIILLLALTIIAVYVRLDYKTTTAVLLVTVMALGSYLYPSGVIIGLALIAVGSVVYAGYYGLIKG